MTVQGRNEELRASSRERKRGNHFTHEAIAALGVAAVGYVGAFVSGVVTARLLGTAGKGVLSLFLTTIAGLSAFSIFGLGQGQIYHSAKAPATLRFFIPHAVVLSIVLGGAAAALYLLIAGHLGQTRLLEQLGVIGPVLVVVGVPVSSFLMFQRQYLLTIGRYTLAKAVGSVTAAAPLLAIAVLYTTPQPITLRTVITGVVVVYCVMVGVAQFVLHVPFWQPGGFSPSYLKDSLSFGIRQWTSEVTHFLTSRLDFFIVAWLSGEAGLGIYSVAVGLAEIVSRLAYEVGTMMFPAVAAGSLRNRQAPVILRTSVALAALLAVIIATLAGPVVIGLYGAAFAEAVPVLEVLLIGTVAWSAAQILWLYASGAGNLEFVLLVLGGATALDVGLNLILQPRMGVLGAGVAATISYCAAAAALLPVFCRRERCTVSEALFVRVSDLRRLVSLAGEMLGQFRTRPSAEEQL